MAIQISSTFSRYDLTEDEKVTGAQLTLNQQYIIQNALADIADQILNLSLDPLNPIEFTQQESYLKGQLAVYRYLLDASKAVSKFIEL